MKTYSKYSLQDTRFQIYDIEWGSIFTAFWAMSTLSQSYNKSLPKIHIVPAPHHKQPFVCISTDSEATEVSWCAHHKYTHSFSWETVKTEVTSDGNKCNFFKVSMQYPLGALPQVCLKFSIRDSRCHIYDIEWGSIFTAFWPCQYSVRVITSLSQRHTLFQYPILSNSLFVKCIDSEATEVSRCAHNRLIHLHGNKWKRRRHLVVINAIIYWEPHLRNDLKCKLSFGA